jgi:protein O-GlcNAc transferase
MDYHKFIQKLPDLYENWGREFVKPKSDQFQGILDEINGMTTSNILQLLNFAVECLEDDEIYCEIGSFQGSTLIGALLNNTDKLAYGVDNFSEFDPEGINYDQLVNNLTHFGIEEQILFCNQDFEEFFSDLKEVELPGKIGVYLYDGAHDYRSQLLGLLLVRPFLADRALIIVDDSNGSAVQQANWDFLASCPQCQLLFDFPTPKDQYPTFWGGIQVFCWDINQDFSLNWSEFSQSFRNKPFLKEIYGFSHYFEFNVKPHNINILRKEALEFYNINQLDQATEKYQEILQWDPYDDSSWFMLGLIKYNQSHLQTDFKVEVEYDKEAINLILKALGIAPLVGNYHYTLGLILDRLADKDQAIKHYQTAIKLQPNLESAYNKLIQVFLEVGNSDQAIEIATQACDLFPHNFLFKLKKYLTLPSLYKDKIEIQLQRDKFIKGLDILLQEINLDSLTLAQKQQLAIDLQEHNNFYLSYQGLDSLELLTKYGKFVHQLMKDIYPQWSIERKLRKLEKGEKIKIGYLSRSLREHTVGKLMVGWLKHHDQQKFEVFTYYLGNTYDEFTEQFETNSDHFYQVLNLYTDWQKICEEIVKDQLDILVIFDIGMDAYINKIAALKLAPIQCTTWAHPETSGLPTMDYFLSSDLMEITNSQKYYSETLINLPKIGISYPKPVLPKLVKQRKDFHFPDDSIIYLCCQNLIKYLPQYDYIWPEIAQKVPSSKFVFINRRHSEVFGDRLKNIFKEYGLNYQDYCIILPFIEHEDYFQVNLLSDIFLDSFSWSGGHTTLEALACNLPVVTCPQDLMRSRHSYGILKMLEVEETIANNEKEYIDIAIKLGLDYDWRNNIKQKIKNNLDFIYDDLECIKSLEKFYEKVVLSS